MNILCVLKSRRGQIWVVVILIGGALVFFAPEEEPVTIAGRSRPRVMVTESNKLNLSSANTLMMEERGREKRESFGDCDKNNACVPEHDWRFRSHFKITPADAFRPLVYTHPPLPAVAIPQLSIPLPPPPPPKPVAPPLPFKYLGKMGEHHAVQKEEEMYELVVGQTIAEHYKVENLTDEQATFIYLPLEERQVLLLRNE